MALNDRDDAGDGAGVEPHGELHVADARVEDQLVAYALAIGLVQARHEPHCLAGRHAGVDPQQPTRRLDRRPKKVGGRRGRGAAGRQRDDGCQTIHAYGCSIDAKISSASRIVAVDRYAYARRNPWRCGAPVKAALVFATCTFFAASLASSSGYLTLRGSSSHSVGPPPGRVHFTPSGISSSSAARHDA